MDVAECPWAVAKGLTGFLPLLYSRSLIHAMEEDLTHKMVERPMDST